MRSLLRPFATLLMAVGVATCSDSPTGPRRESPAPSNGIGREAVAFAPVFSKAASATSARLPDFSISYDRVRIVLVRPVADTVKDTTIVFTPGSADVTLELNVDVRSPTELFDGVIDYANAAGVVFHGEGKVQAHPANQPAPTPQPIIVDYVGPGSQVAHVVVSPNPATVLATETTTFTASAVDSSGAAIAVPVSWAVSDPSIASISSTGLFVPAGKRGTVTVTATTPTKISDNASVSVVLPAASISLVSGGGQTGKVGGALANPAVVRVVAVDGLGVPGVSVNFGAPIGGSIGASSVVTDASGNASTSMQLGTVAGPQSFVASTGSFSVAIPEVASAGNAAIIAVASGSGQSDTVRHALKAPLVVKVSDTLSNPVPGVVVNWAKTAGGGALGAATSTTGSDGLASVGYTLGSTVGTETVSASVAGVTAAASFTMAAVAATPSGLSVVSGADQTGTAGAPLASPIVVKVVDPAGNPIAGASVSWSSNGGTVAAGVTSTGADGLTSNTFTLGKVAGVFSVTASVSATASVTTNATAVAGAAASLVWQVQPSSVAAASVIAPAVRVALVDVNGNVAASTNTISLTLAGGTQGAQLAGTKSRAAVAGVATFDDLKVDLVGSGYTLGASSAGITATASSSSFAVVAGSGQIPTQLLLDPASPTTFSYVAGVTPTSPPSLEVLDAGNTPVSGVPVRVVLTKVVNGSTVTVGDATANSDVAGHVTFFGTLPDTATTYKATATSTSISDVNAKVVATIVIEPAAAAKLSITAPTSMTSGTPSTVTVNVQDRFGNALTGATSAITLVATGAASATFGPTNAINGVATFSPSLTVAGNYTLTASTTSFTATTVPASVTVGAATASQMIVTTGTSTAPSLVVASSVAGFAYPSVTLLDAGGNPAPNAGTVTYTLTSSAGPCTILNGGAVPVNANGVAALSATYLGITTATASSCTLHAVSSLVSGTTYDFNVVVAPTSGISWLGKSSTNFADTANWRGSIVPSGSDAIFIPRYSRYSPSMAGHLSNGGVAVEALGTLDLGGATDTLKVSGNVATNSTGTITNGVVMTTSSGTVEGKLPGLAVAGASTLTGTTSATAVKISSGSLDIAGTTLTVSGDFTTTETGILKMLANTPTNVMSVSGDVSFDGGSEAGFLTQGTLNASGKFTQSHTTSPSSFAPSGVIFSVFFAAQSGGAQIVSFADPEDSFFANVVAKHSTTFTTRTLINSTLTTSGSGTIVAFSGTDSLHNVVVGNLTTLKFSQPDNPITGLLDVNGNGIITKTSGNVGVTVTGETNTESSSSLSGIDTLTSKSTTFPKINGAAPSSTVLTAASTLSETSMLSGPLVLQNALTVNGHTFSIGGSLSVTGTNGKLIMTNVSDHVTVSGNATFDGASTSGALTAGLLEITGNITQQSDVSTSSFVAASAHTTKLAGTGGQSVTFADPVHSYFYNLNVANGSSGVTGTRATVNGALTTGTTSDLYSLDSLVVTGTTFPSYSNTTAGKGPHVTVITNSAAAMSANATVPGGLGIGTGGSLSIGAHTLTIIDSLVVDGNLDMASTSSVVAVANRARFRGGAATTGLQAGTLKFAGEFIEEGTAASFAPANGVLVQLNGTSSQAVSFTRPGTSNAHFANLEIDNTSTDGVKFNTDVNVTGYLDQKGRLAITSGTTTVDGIADFGHGQSATTDISGTLSLATANFYMGSKTTGTGVLNLSPGNCHHGSLSPTDLLVGSGGLFNLTSCVGTGISP